MNRQYLEYSPEVGAPTANSHHGQQHRLQKQPECKAANLSENHNAENLFSLGGPCRRFSVSVRTPASVVCRSVDVAGMAQASRVWRVGPVLPADCAFTDAGATA